jgi:Ca2+:H+ antiporter
VPAHVEVGEPLCHQEEDDDDRKEQRIHGNFTMPAPARFGIAASAKPRTPLAGIVPWVRNSAGKIALRVLLVLLLLLGPLVVVLDRLDAAGDITLFLLAAAALVPLAWLIGEATDDLAVHTGPGIGGFLNATFGNAPELIIAIVAVADGLNEIVRASLVGSIAGNLLLVLGFTLLLGQRGAIDRRSAAISLGLVGFATLVLVITSIPGFHGDPDRHSLAVFSLPFAVLLLGVRLVVSRRALRRQRELYTPPENDDGARSVSSALLLLGGATVLTALVTETLVGTLQTFAERAHLSEFFVAIVIVAIVGNATEHGSAVLLARRGRVKLAVEIPLASSSQIAGLLIPLVAIVSWAFDPLALSFRPIELAAMGASAALPALALASGRTTRLGGAILLGAYAAFAVAFFVAGDR